MSTLLSILLKLRVEILPAARQALENAPQILIEELTLGLRRVLLLVESAIKQQITSIHLIDTDRLRSSIHGDVISVTAGGFRGEVASGSDVVYASIHEMGGVIEPKNGRVLVWVDKGITRPAPGDKEGWRALRKAGSVHFAKRVTIKAKHYMRDGLRNAVAGAHAQMKVAVQRAWNRILGNRGEL